MSASFMNTEDIKATLRSFHEQLEGGKRLNELPLKVIDWNSGEGITFIRERCRQGNADDIVKHFRLLKLNERNVKRVLAIAVRYGARIGMLPLDHVVKVTKGKELYRNDLLDTIVECGGAKDFLALLRLDRTLHGEKKYEVYDYIVAEYRKKGFGTLPNSEVVFGMDYEDEKREENERKNHITKEKMDYLAKQLNDEGIQGIKTLWRMDTGLGILQYPNAEDVKEYPAFTEALAKVIDWAVEKNFEEAHKCARAFPLLYGGGTMSHAVPDAVEKAFKKYPMMLKSVERTFLEDAGDREKYDYFFFTKIAVTNPEFNWNDINLAMLPKDGVPVYNENDEMIVLNLQEQLNEFVLSACEAGISGAVIPQDYSSYHDEQIGVLKILVKWRKAEKKEAREDESGETDKQSFMGKILGLFRKKEPPTPQ